MGPHLPGVDPAAGGAWLHLAADYVFISALWAAAPHLQCTGIVDVWLATGKRLGFESLFGILFLLHGGSRVNYGCRGLHAHPGALADDHHHRGFGWHLRASGRVWRVVWRKRDHDVSPAVHDQGQVLHLGDRVSYAGGSDSGDRRRGEFRAPGWIAVRILVSEVSAAARTNVFGVG